MGERCAGMGKRTEVDGEEDGIRRERAEEESGWHLFLLIFSKLKR